MRLFNADSDEEETAGLPVICSTETFPLQHRVLSCDNTRCSAFDQMIETDVHMVRPGMGTDKNLAISISLLISLIHSIPYGFSLAPPSTTTHSCKLMLLGQINHYNLLLLKELLNHGVYSCNNGTTVSELYV